MSIPAEFRFDGWTLRTDTGDLSREGQTTRLQEQPLQVLTELLRRPGEMVTREQLIALLWPTGVVEFDTNLNTAIRKLRQALGDDAATPRYIETLPRKGYRFIGRLDPPVSADASPAELLAPGLSLPGRPGAVIYLLAALGLLLAAGAWFWLRDGGSASHPLVSEPSIIVLPLRDMSTTQADQALCDGVTEEISNWLAQIPALKVVARTSAFSFKQTDADVRTIGEQVGAAYVLEGSLRRHDETVRITVQLVSARDGYHVWSQTYDLQAEDVLRIEDTIARAVAEALNIRLPQEVGARWSQMRATVPAAYAHYLKGLPLQRQRTPTSNTAAIQHYRAAIAADPGFAPAHVRLAQSLLNEIGLNGRTVGEVEEEVTRLTAEALRLAPDMPQALATQGWLATERFRMEEAIPLFRKALALNPNDADTLRLSGYAHAQLARPAEALDDYTRAVELDPLDFMTQVLQCRSLRDMGRFDEAQETCAKARRLDERNVWGYLGSSWVAYARGDLADALRWTERAQAIDPGDPFLKSQRIDLLLALDMVSEARALLEGAAEIDPLTRSIQQARIDLAASGAQALQTALRGIEVDPEAGADSLLSLAQLHLTAGHIAEAMQFLKRAQAAPDYRSADTSDPSFFCLAYSGAIPIAAIQAAGGQKDLARETLAPLLGSLQSAERQGMDCYGLHSLRAEALALLEQPEPALNALRTAAARGWKGSFSARHDPYLRVLRERADFQSLIAEVERANQRTAERIRAAGATR